MQTINHLRAPLVHVRVSCKHVLLQATVMNCRRFSNHRAVSWCCHQDPRNHTEEWCSLQRRNQIHSGRWEKTTAVALVCVADAGATTLNCVICAVLYGGRVRNNVSERTDTRSKAWCWQARGELKTAAKLSIDALPRLSVDFARNAANSAG